MVIFIWLLLGFIFVVGLSLCLLCGCRKDSTISGETSAPDGCDVVD